MTQPVTAALNKDALLAKSQLYVRKALIQKASGDLAEYQLWASLALELIGKSALANIHPSLIADPQHYQSLFAASGVNISTDIKTITAKTLFERLQHLVKPFDAEVKEFCDQVANRRNAELHSGDVPFAATRTERWEAKYWYAVDIILSYMDNSLESWLGADDAAIPKEILENAFLAKQHSIEGRIKSTRDIFKKKKKADREKAINVASERSIADFPRLFRFYFDGIWECECPSCSAKAYVAGEMISEEVVDTQPDEYSMWETVEREFSGEQFCCPTCGLSLNSYDELNFANLPTDFADMVEREMEFEPDYGND